MAPILPLPKGNAFPNFQQVLCTKVRIEGHVPINLVSRKKMKKALDFMLFQYFIREKDNSSRIVFQAKERIVPKNLNGPDVYLLGFLFI